MGRKRIHPEGATAKDRVAASNAALRESGGARKSVRLTSKAVAAIGVLKERWSVETETEVIERSLIESAGLDE